MTRTLSLILSLASCLFLALACSNEHTPTFVPGNVSDNNVAGDADYSGLVSTNHPRIMITDDDLDVIRAKVASDENVAKLHDLLMTYADRTLTMSDITYTLSGRRLLTTCQNAARRIISCAYAYRYTGEQAYLDKAEKDLQTVCAFPDWNAPAHFLDPAEMCLGVGIGYDWLYNELSASTKSAVETAVENYAFYCAMNSQWNLDFYNSSTNWNEVCNGGLVVAAFAIYEASSNARTIIEKAIESNVPALQEMYDPDGNYPEGYSYWGYGTAFECIMLSAMETCTGSDNSIPEAVSGFAKTGKYIMFMEGLDKRPFNYADCDTTSDPFHALWYLAWKYNDPSMLYAELWKLNNGVYSSDARYDILAIAYASKFDLGAVTAPEDKLWSGKGINPVVLVHGDWSFTDTDKFLGIKAGRANYSHGHMDVGSFVYDAYGTRWSADLGLQSYETLENYPYDTSIWSENYGHYEQTAFRWGCFRYNNYNHSTITINDALHKASGIAELTSVTNSSTSKGAVVDMTNILTDECESARRTVTLDNDKDVVVIDEIKAYSDKAAEVRWTMVTMAVPTVESDRIVLQGNNNKNLYLTAKSSSNAKITLTTWSTVGNDWDASNDGYYEAGFTATVPAGQSDTFTVTLSPDE